jgi:N-acetylmuramoyl-L-alanine amidase
MRDPKRIRGLLKRAAGAGVCAALLLAAFTPASAVSVARKKQIARTQFEQAERMREALNGRPVKERTQAQFQKVTDAYRRVYYVAPTSNRADASVLAVAELLAEQGRTFDDDKLLKSAIGQYEFLRREYPGSKHRASALFAIAEIYQNDLGDNAKAKSAYEDFLKHYPGNALAADARQAIAQMDADARKAAAKPAKSTESKQARVEPKKTPEPKEARNEPAPEKSKPDAENKRAAAAVVDDKQPGKLPLVTGIRHWSTPDYTRVAIDLEQELKYDAGRVPSPDRIFFDLHGSKLAPGLKGKVFDIEDGFLHKVRVAQYQPGETRIVLEVDDVAEYSAFLLPNPFRLIVDVHGKKETAAKKAATATSQAQNAQATQKTDKTDKPVLATTEVVEKKTAADATRPKTSETARVVTPVESKAPETKAAVETKPVPSKPAKVVETAASKEPAKEPAGREIEDRSAEADDTPAAVSTAGMTPIQKKMALAREAEFKRDNARRKKAALGTREARPTAGGDRSLIRALGLKIGRIVVDAGHGGHDTGTIGPQGLEEKDLVLDVALRLGHLLEKAMGADVVYTRDDDTFIPLETRTAIANREQADLFISVHANSSQDDSARGVETYYLNFSSSPEALEVAARENAVSEKSIHELQDLVKKIAMKEKIEESREFAAEVQKSLSGGLSTRGSNMRDRGVKKAPFIVLIGASMPSILAEISFLSNPGDERRLLTPEYRQKIAESLYRGIARYVGGLSGVKVASRDTRATGQ